MCPASKDISTREFESSSSGFMLHTHNGIPAQTIKLKNGRPFGLDFVIKPRINDYVETKTQ